MEAIRPGKHAAEVVPVEVVKKAPGLPAVKENVVQDQSVDPGLTVEGACVSARSP